MEKSRLITGRSDRSQDPDTLSNNRLWVPAVLCWLLSGFWLLSLDDPRRRFLPFLAGIALMGLAWQVLLRSAHSARALRWCVAAGLLLRIVALFEAPAFSDDVFRYVFEGRAVWYAGPGFPFSVPPSDAVGHVPPHLLDEAWLRINHPHISTIYPPVSQLLFAIAGGLGELAGRPLLLLKGLLVLTDLGVWYLLRRSPYHLAWGLCPLVVWEVAREGHADSISALGLAVAVVAFSRADTLRGYAGLGLAALAKLNGLIAIVAAARSTRRHLWVALLLTSLLALPFVMAGAQAGFGLGQYASRWRSGDGLFSIVLMLARSALGADWHPGLRVSAHQVARAVTAVLGLGVAFAVLRRPASLAAIAPRAGLLLLFLLLLSPTLHPWYVLWLLPFLAAPTFVGRRAVLLLALLAPLLHHPGWMELSSGRWTDLGWVRMLVHVPVWGLLVWDLVRAGGLGYPAAR